MTLRNNWANGELFQASDINDITNAVNAAAVSVNFANYGACDGTTNDTAAFTQALVDLSSAGGGTLVLPPKSIALTLNAEPTFNIPANTKIVGTPGATKLLLTSTNNTSYVAFAG